MTEKILRCPRCGARTPITSGKCVYCGLAVTFAQRVNRRADEPGRSAAVDRLGEGNDRVDHELGGGFHRAAPPGAAFGPPAGRRFEAELPRRGAALNPTAEGAAPPEPVLVTGRYDLDAMQPGGGSERNEGEAIVGSLSSLLADPSEDPRLPPSEPSPAPVGGGPQVKLDMGPRFRETEKADNLPADASAAVESWAAEPAMRSASEVVSTRADEIRATRWNYLVTRVAPMAVIFLLVAVVGRLYVTGPVTLDGDYEATFADDEGRKIDCSTRFAAGVGNPLDVHGVLLCKLFPTGASIERVDEPRALKPAMGDGRISYTGRYSGEGLELTLGGDASDPRAVRVVAHFVGDETVLKGTATDKQGHHAQVQFQKKL